MAGRLGFEPIAQSTRPGEFRHRPGKFQIQMVACPRFEPAHFIIMAPSIGIDSRSV